MVNVNSADYYDGDNALGSGLLGSVALYKNSYQVSVNGSNLFSGDGPGSMNERLALLNDTFGDVVMTQFHNSIGVSTQTECVGDVKDFSGVYDYNGFRLEDKVRNLQLTYRRSKSEHQAAANKVIYLNLYGEVLKNISFSNGGYVISYV